MAAKKVHDGPHKYQRIKQTSRNIWRCMLTNCTHFLRREEIIGKESICHRCGKKFLIEKALIHLKKLHCRECTKTRDLDTETEDIGGMI